MSEPMQQRRVEPPRPPTEAHREASPRSQSVAETQAQAPVPSIETPISNHSQRQSSSSLQTLQSRAQNPLFRIPQSPRTAPRGTSQKAAKVAIPRVKRFVDATGEDTGQSRERYRVGHACEPCRHRKTKCGGERPVCRHCQDFKITCFYADGKRDRVKK